MNKNSNTYILTYAGAMVVFVALVLSFASVTLKPRQRANQENEMKAAILRSIGRGLDVPRGRNRAAHISELYARYIVDSYAVDIRGNVVEGADAFAILVDLRREYERPADERRLPVFVSRDDDGAQRYILPLRGTGLWGPLWGYLALEDDWKTIYGVILDHQGETPGLGAEISTPPFQRQFDGKSIFRDGKLVGISVLKGAGSSAGNDNAVDGISGGTITSRGVEQMLRSNLAGYEAYINRRIAERAAAARQDAGITQNTEDDE